MEIVIQPSVEEASIVAARLTAQLIGRKPNAVLGLATGSTPLPFYRELVRMHRQDGLDFSQVTTFNLDEYIGLKGDHPCSYRYFMDENLFNHINIRKENTHVPDGMSEDVPGSCATYEEEIRQAGGIDLQVLGIGGDGHIGFNEPGSSLASRTRIKTLTEETREDNARFFDSMDDVPMHCITMGIGTIMESRQIVFLAFSERKAGIVHEATEGPITATVPASVLQMHPNVKVFLDEPAAGKLARYDYYKWVYDNKPEWQQF
jgi:glucosamine-6-phosphate deaminase